MKGIRVIGGYIATVAVVMMCAMSTQASAQDGKKMEQNQAKPDVKMYSYVAQPGDAYTQLVRKAVQTYGVNHKKNIGNARIVAIETKLSEQAGWPVLEVGQKVKFEESKIASAVEAAMKLSDTELALWQTYVPYISFKTNHIGE